MCNSFTYHHSKVSFAVQ
uniref:Uncharacterized protein n=1 Tax=Arundo donax TaxID=35708 RepID=A0A0A9G450_ARUDO